MNTFVEALFHMDEWIQQIATLHPVLTYSLFFAIVFLESAFFPTAPILPGDALLFMVGVLAANGTVSLSISIIVLIMAGVAGNYVAYQLGKWLGSSIFDRFSWLNRNHYQHANEFYDKHGYKALLFSRFIPIVRALVPFVAGISRMNYAAFRKYNIISVFVWVLLIVLIAYFLGHLPFIKQHFTWVIFGLTSLGILFVLFVGIRKLLQYK